MFRRSLLVAASAFAFSAVPIAAFAQERTDDQRPSVDNDIIVTGELEKFGATKSETPILETARSISIETERDFRDKGFETLADALSYTAGVTAKPFGFDMRGDFASVRGLTVPEYRDNLQFLFGFYNNPRPELYLAEQVEVLKGPASVLYGSGSPGGIVNVVTKRPFDGSLTEMRGRIGNFDRYEVMTDLNTAIPGTGGTGFARFTGLYRNTGTQIDQVDEEKIVIAPSFSARPTDSTTITLLTNYTSQKTDTGHQFLPLNGTLLPAGNGRTIDPLVYLGEPGFNRYDSESVSVTLLLDQKIAEGLSFEAVGRYVAADAEYNQSWPLFTAVGTPRIDANGNATRSFYSADNRSETAAFDARLRGTFATGPLRHEVLAGVQYQDVMTESDFAQIDRGTINVFDPVYGDGPTLAELEAAKAARLGNRNNNNYVDTVGYYINDQVTLGPLIVNGGVRFDRVTNQTGNGFIQRDNATSFSGGALLRGPFGLSPYISYAESFQPVVGLDALTGDRLQPQRGKQYEAGLKWPIPGTTSSITFAAFDIEQSNLSNPQAIVGAGSQQLGISKIRGIEVEGNAAIGGLRLDANYSLLDTEDPNGFRLASVPREQASVFAIYRFAAGMMDGFRIGGGVRHASGVISTGFLRGGIPLSYATEGYTVGDASAGYRWGAWDLSVNARNVTNERYYTTCLTRGDCYPSEDRTVIATLGYRM